MHPNDSAKPGSRTGVSISMLGLLLLFLIACAILLRIFTSALTISQASRARSAAAELCRSAGEVFSATGSLEETAAVLGGSGETVYFSADLSCSAQEDAIYTLTMEATDQRVTAGTLRCAQFCVSQDDTALYTLTAEHYLPEVEP